MPEDEAAMQGPDSLVLNNYCKRVAEKSTDKQSFLCICFRDALCHLVWNTKGHHVAMEGERKAGLRRGKAASVDWTQPEDRVLNTFFSFFLSFFPCYASLMSWNFILRLHSDDIAGQIREPSAMDTVTWSRAWNAQRSMCIFSVIVPEPRCHHMRHKVTFITKIIRSKKNWSLNSRINSSNDLLDVDQRSAGILH